MDGKFFNIRSVVYIVGKLQIKHMYEVQMRVSKCNQVLRFLRELNQLDSVVPKNGILWRFLDHLCFCFGNSSEKAPHSFFLLMAMIALFPQVMSIYSLICTTQEP